MSEQKQKPKEEPFNHKAEAKTEPINYEKEFYDLLDMVSDLGLQMQNVVRNTKLRLKGQPMV